MRTIEIPEDNPCRNCMGLRKILNPETNQWQPCPICEGDGSNSGKIGLCKEVIKLFKQEGTINQED